MRHYFHATKLQKIIVTQRIIFQPVCEVGQKVRGGTYGSLPTTKKRRTVALPYFEQYASMPFSVGKQVKPLVALELKERVVAVGIAKEEAIGGCEVDDFFAGLDSSGGVVVVTGTEVGVLELEVLGMNNVACYQAIAYEIDRMAGGMAGGRNGFNYAIDNSVAVGKGLDAPFVGCLHLFPKVVLLGHGSLVSPCGAFFLREV